MWKVSCDNGVLVAPEGTRIPAGGGPRETGFNPVSALQNMMKDVLELEFQLEHIDYNRENFVHADMTPQEFAESMRNNEESIARIFFRMLGFTFAKFSLVFNQGFIVRSIQ